MFIELGNIHADWRNIYIGKTQHTLKKGMDGDFSYFQFFKNVQNSDSFTSHYQLLEYEELIKYKILIEITRK